MHLRSFILTLEFEDRLKEPQFESEKVILKKLIKDVDKEISGKKFKAKQVFKFFHSDKQNKKIREEILIPWMKKFGYETSDFIQTLKELKETQKTQFDYEEIKKLAEAYRKDTRWFPGRIRFEKILEQFGKNMKNLVNHKLDLADLKKILGLREQNSEIPESLKTSWFNRKYNEYLILNNFIEHINEFIIKFDANSLSMTMQE